MSSQSGLILHVEDHEDSRAVINILLTQHGYQVTSVETRAEALEHALLTSFDLFLLDFQLRDMDGAQMCKRLREQWPHTPVIFLSGDATESSREVARQAGASAYLLKPLGVEDLPKTIASLIHK
jgi:CheY-like chemotaxis protein